MTAERNLCMKLLPPRTFSSGCTSCLSCHNCPPVTSGRGARNPSTSARRPGRARPELPPNSPRSARRGSGRPSLCRRDERRGSQRSDGFGTRTGSLKKIIMPAPVKRSRRALVREDESRCRGTPSWPPRAWPRSAATSTTPCSSKCTRAMAASPATCEPLSNPVRVKFVGFSHVRRPHGFARLRWCRIKCLDEEYRR